MKELRLADISTIEAGNVFLPGFLASQKDQRVSHTAIVENKRLGHVLRTIKAQQNTHRAPTVETNSEKLGYKKRPRKLYGPDYVEASAPPAEAVEMTA